MSSERLENLAEITAGTSPKGEFINSEGLGLPFFQGSKEFGDLFPRAERFTEHPVRTAKKGDILVSVRAPVGEVNFAPYDCAIGRGVMAVSPKSTRDGKFLFYFLRSMDGKWDSIGSSGSVFENLSAPVLRSVEIPTGLDRWGIGEILHSLDQKIENNKKLSSTLESIAQTIFKSWFMEFDPVHAKSHGEQPEGMDAETAAIFPDSFEESELGLIPRGWVLASLSQNFSIVSGGTPKTNVDAYWNGDIPWYSVADLPTGNAFFVKTSKTITELGVKHSAVNVLEAKTTIISARGTVGKVAMNGVPSAFNQSCYGLQGTEPYFIYCLTKQYVPRLLNITHGGTFDTITRSSFDSIHVPSIPEALKRRFENVVLPIIDQVRNLGAQNETLSSIRDSLLPRLISGELEIPEELLVD